MEADFSIRLLFLQKFNRENVLGRTKSFVVKIMYDQKLRKIIIMVATRSHSLTVYQI